MSINLVVLLYLVASICFIQALKGLSHPTTSIRGNLFGMSGMAIAVVTTAALIFNQATQLGQVDPVQGLGWVLLGLVVGGGAGAIMAQRVEMTKMPELVAFMHSMIGLAMNTAAKPIMLCIKATSSGILVISTRCAMMAPAPPPITRPSSTQPMPCTGST